MATITKDLKSGITKNMHASKATAISGIEGFEGGNPYCCNESLSLANQI
jgi:hypothetical protein